MLKALAADEPTVQLIHLPRNGGKGRALTAGLIAARAIPAIRTRCRSMRTGQHNAGDVPRFLAEGRVDPQALICGQPIYDESAPRARLYGRYVTHVCVWLETLSFTLRDSMCGYRLYPLEVTCAEIDRAPLPARMDFDTEVAVAP